MTASNILVSPFPISPTRYLGTRKKASGLLLGEVRAFSNSDSKKKKTYLNSHISTDNLHTGEKRKFKHSPTWKWSRGGRGWASIWNPVGGFRKLFLPQKNLHDHKNRQKIKNKVMELFKRGKWKREQILLAKPHHLIEEQSLCTGSYLYGA